MIPSHFAVQQGQPQHLPSLHHMKCAVWTAVDVTMTTRKYFYQNLFFPPYFLFFLFVVSIGFSQAGPHPHWDKITCLLIPAMCEQEAALINY